MNVRLGFGAIVVFLLAATASPAAAVDVGAEVGLSFAKFVVENERQLPLPIDRYSRAIWLRGGVRVRAPLTRHLALVSGVLYESNGWKADLGQDRIVTERLEYITAPLGLEFAAPTGSVRPFGRVAMELGWLADADEFTSIDGERLGDGGDTDEWYLPVESTLAVGGGLRFSARWDVHGAYRHGLTNTNVALNRDAHVIHNRAWVLGVTYWFRALRPLAS